MNSVAIVTDSTANLPSTIVDFWGITVVPVQVIIAGQGYDEGVEITASRLAEALRQWAPVSTSRPSPGQFLQVYRELAEGGVDHIVSAHLSSELSGTHDSAVMAAADSPVPVTVVDSRSVSMGLGFACVAGSRILARGAGPGEAALEIRETAIRSRVLFYVDSLDYLRRGGRIGAGERLIGQALAVKPILHLDRGRVQPLEKVRTASKALGRLEDLAVESAGALPASVAVMHLDADQRAQDLAQRIRNRLPSADVLIGELGAVIGSHVGPGTVAVIVSPVPPP